ncbi:MAG: energy transducer TonB [Robiginitomaculum sp.]
MIKNGFIFTALLFAACASAPQAFMPSSDYPNDPWVKGYSNPDDCLGGEKLAARNFALPEYPRKAYKSGRQGWALLRLDVNAQGEVQNVEVERALPAGVFGGNARRAAEKWQFMPPQDGPLENCRVLLRYKLGGVTLGS